MNYLKSMLGFGAAKEEDSTLSGYNEFVETEVPCKLYELAGDNKACQCIQGSAGFDVKKHKDGQMELSMIVSNLLFDEDQGNDKYFVFPLNEQVVIRRYVYKEDENVIEGLALIYLNQEDDSKYLIEFAEDVDADEVNTYVDKVNRMLYEAIRKEPATPQQKEQYSKLVEQGILIISSTVNYYADVLQAQKENFSSPQNMMSQEEEIKEQHPPAAPQPKKKFGLSLEMETELKTIPFPTLFQGNGSLYMVDRITDTNKLAQHNVWFAIREGAQLFEYELGVWDGEDALTAGPLNTQTHISASPYENSVFWASFDHVTDEFTAWVFRFSGDGFIFPLRTVLSRCMFEASRKEEMAKAVQEQDRSWIANSFTNSRDVEMLGGDELEGIEDMELDQNTEESDEGEKNVPSALKFVPPYEEDDKHLHRETIQAGCYNRVFSARGNDFDIYSHNAAKGAVEASDEVLKFEGSLPIVKTLDDRRLIPRQMMLHSKDTNLLVLDKEEKEKIFSVDLEKGKVVEEWKGNAATGTLLQMSHQFKNANLEAHDCFVGIGQKALQLYDPRIGKAEKVASERTYKTNPKFSCVVTTRDGHIAVGSTNGEIRLYKQVNQIAKTLLPGLGDPIMHIDTTLKGEWVLATCETYLLVIPTTFQETKSGFTARMGKDKPDPFKLAIKPRDIAHYNLKQVRFTNARFDNKDPESSILTSTGEFIVTWSFSKVKRGILTDYKVKPMRQSVCDNSFRYGTDRSIVVTLPEALKLQKRRKL